MSVGVFHNRSWRNASAPWLALAVLLATVLIATAVGQPQRSPAYLSAESKFNFIRENAQRTPPSTRPTVLTAEEWNAYLNEGGVKLPEGITGVHVTSQPPQIQAEAEIDFDLLTQNRTRNNPLMQLFTGRHHVTALARAWITDGVATVHVESIQFDGVEIPRFALEYFAYRFLRPKYGNAIGMDSSFPVHAHIWTATPGANQVTITQR